jgi:hypothetical protein
MPTEANQTEPPVTNPLFKVTVVQPLIEARTGELRVEVMTNALERSVSGVMLRLQEVTGTTYPGARRFAIVPPFEDGGYAIREIRPGARLERTFSVRPVEAEVGSVTQFEVSLGFCREVRPEPYRERESYGSAQEPVYEDITGSFSLRLEARPEVYAALGAIERVRDGLLRAYEDLQETGRRTQEKHGSTWPATPPLEAQVALSQDSFQRLFEAIEVGVRIVDNLSRRSRGGPTS